MRLTRLAVAAGLTSLLALAAIAPAAAYGTASGYAVSDFATGFTPNSNSFGVGPVGLAFDATNHLYVMEYTTGYLYKFGTSGGQAGTSTRVNAVAIQGTPAGIAFTKDGRLYAALQASGSVVEINPTTGVQLRVVATDIGQATGIATDPLSGDLFVTSPCCNVVIRLSNFATGTATRSTYAEVATPDGITFGPDGTMYLASLATGGHAVKVVGTNSTASRTPTNLANVSTIDGIALLLAAGSNTPTAIFGNRNDGKITKVDLTKSPPELTDIVTGGSRGDLSAVGPDGCLYATQSTTVAKVTNADGTCSFAPTVAVPVLRLTPATQTAPVRTAVSISATLTNATAAGHVVTFTVTGANPQVGTATTDASGKATFTYTGLNTGDDTVSAATTANDQAVTSNAAGVAWTVNTTVTPSPTPLPPILAQTGGPNLGFPLAVVLLMSGLGLLVFVGRRRNRA